MWLGGGIGHLPERFLPEVARSRHYALACMLMKDDRPALAQFDEIIEDEEAKVTVTLAWNDQAYEGSAVGASGEYARPRLIGEATLRAVEAISEGKLSLDLAAVATTDLGASRVAIAQVASKTLPSSLVGSAVIHENDPAKATARAVLDAINRHLAQSL